MAGERQNGRGKEEAGKQKPYLRLAADDSKPILRDLIAPSDPVETEQSALRLPPLSKFP